ncbi:MAG TPA: methyltransferase domain-containing protein [Gaiellaceae bacterium]|nr:methyltransferase domain-containing protein [Gaiellaceae bacterium]
MRLDVPDLDSELERDIERRAPWMHPYHFGGPVYVGLFKHHGLGVTFTTSGASPATVERMRGAFEAYMEAQPFHDVDVGLARIAEETGRTLSEMRVLDIASATGRYTFRAAQLGAPEVVGVEIRPSQVEQAHLVHQVAANLSKLPVMFVHDPTSADADDFRHGERYDIVLSMGLLYHLRDPLQHLKNLARLARRGVLVHTMANIYGRRGLWMPMVEDPRQMTKAVEGLGWAPYFRELPELLRSAGFVRAGLIEHPLVRGLRPPLEQSRLRRAFYLATPPAATAVVTRARARMLADRRADVLRRSQSPFYFTLWATR